MILTQTRAMFVDAYRELNAKKLFWITMGISIFIVVACALIGINERGLTFFIWTIDLDQVNTKFIPANLLYKFMFSVVAIPMWLTWGATILALVSTAGIIPEFVSGGAIEMTLSKPIGRLRLILLKYVSALTFVALQVMAFTLGWFVLIGIRGHSWEPRLLLAVPIVLLFFSYIYAVCALVGMLTRSTIAALIATAIFWLAIFGVHLTEQIFLQLKVNNLVRQDRITAYIQSLEAQRARQEEQAAKEGRTVDPSIISVNESNLARRKTQLDEIKKNEPTVLKGHAIIYAVKSVLPKTSETVGLLQRWLISREEAARFLPPPDADGSGTNSGEDFRGTHRATQQRMDEELRGRTLFWVLGTSLLFEGIVVGGMCWVFCRRDF